MPTRLLIILLVLSIFSASCNSQAVTVFTPDKSDTSAEMKLKVSRQVFRDSLPKPITWTNDFEVLFSDSQKKELNDIIAAYEKKSTIEISIVTVDTSMTAKDNFDALILHIHNTWGVGKKLKNNGIVIGISSGYRKIRISNGYGIEKLLSDSETKQLIDNNFIPLFKQSRYFDGTLNGLQALIAKLETNSN